MSLGHEPPAYDQWSDDRNNSPSDPASSWELVTPDDEAELDPGVRSLWVATAGDVEFVAEGDSVAVLLEDVPAHTAIPVRAKLVQEATTATVFALR